ncbi:hypothetical protein [Bythopirellula goksoeyrii]|uniref:Uncharacterized protein n=1 Tax=Bythopirellula goksoeyrii TaxID=1400387 RepID=A0A5B9Q7F6_9BACT|nr:hypothetical protein [Bythopirellula goksoeyrii]QEG34964.1 hypothetical protein Pr1d_22530 [Bythopirellula goksoeyrii]
MENNTKPLPLNTTTHGKTCPICGKNSYSPAGIHPQCAIQQADAPRQKKLADEKRARKLREESSKAVTAKR